MYASNKREFDRIIPKTTQTLIANAAAWAHWGNPEAAEKARVSAGYGGISKDD